MAPHLGRKITDLTQKTKGRQALRFQLELIPYFLDEIPGKVKQASFMWERGAKLQYTEPSPVQPAERAVYWGNTLLKQTATMYKENEAILAKEYYFKVQSVSGGSNKKRSTFAKTKIDLAKYCNCESNEAREVYIPLSPSGTLRISIQATWLRNASPENDTMTEISGMSLGHSTPSSAEDQDLSGFESKAYRAKSHRGRQKSHSQDPSPSRSEPGPLKRGATGLTGSSGGPDLSLGRRRATFQDVELDDGQDTPRMHSPRRPSAVAASNRPMPPTPFPETSGASTPTASVATGHSKQPSNVHSEVLNESYATLMSSDSEEDAPATKWWWSSDKSKDRSYQSSNLRPNSSVAPRAPSPRVSELSLINQEDVTSLRHLAQQVMRERDQEQMLRQQAERRARHLQSDSEALAMSKSMLVERLREAEDRLLTARQEETMSTLVQTKIKLAQADYVNLELQGHLNHERNRVRQLKQRLTDMEAAYHSTLNSIRLQNITTEGER